jgi:exodeoxyribonuclease-3
VKIVTWNVNSLRARLPRFLPWLQSRDPDVVLLQETKVVDDDFPAAEIEALGWRIERFGQKTYNGVAIVSKLPATDVVKGLPDDGPDADRRVIRGHRRRDARRERLRDRTGRKSAPKSTPTNFVGSNASFRSRRRNSHADFQTVVAGDWNIAPDDRDVYDPVALAGTILCSDAERAAFRSILELGFEDGLRKFTQEAGVYTWWDYRAVMFRRGLGLRIDHVLLDAAASALVEGIDVDREERKGDKPSDHAPVAARFRAP